MNLQRHLMDFERAKAFINYKPSSEVDESRIPYERFTALWDRVNAHNGLITGHDAEGAEYKVIVWCDTATTETNRVVKEIGAEWHFDGEFYFGEKLTMD